MKKIAAAGLAILFLLLAGCADAPRDVPEYPAVLFENRAVTVSCGEEASIHGKLSAQTGGVFLFSLTEPEKYAPMRLRHTPSGDTTQFGSLSWSGDLLACWCLPKLFAAIEASAWQESLTRTETGFSGHTADGDAFSIETGAGGAILKITLSQVTAEFEVPEEPPDAGSSDLTQSATEEPSEAERSEATDESST